MADDPTELPDEASEDEGDSEASEPAEDPGEPTDSDPATPTADPDRSGSAAATPDGGEEDEEDGGDSADVAEPTPPPSAGSEPTPEPPSDTSEELAGSSDTTSSSTFETPADASAESDVSVDASGEVVVDGTLPIRDRIAQTLRDQGPVEAGAELTSTFFGPLKEYSLPLAALVVMLVLVIAFRAVLLPFIFAVALVYLMEPIVGFIGRRPGKQSGLPRWVAVILVYVSFIAVLTTSLVFVVPTFVAEIVRFAEEVPEFVQEFRNERLPGINREVQDFLRNYLPVTPEGDATVGRSHIDRAESAVMSARKVAAAHATAFGNSRATVHWAMDVNFDWTVDGDDGKGATQTFTVAPPAAPRPELTFDDALSSTGWIYREPERHNGLVVTPGENGELFVDLRNVAVEVEKVDDGEWVIRQQDEDTVPADEDDDRVAIDEMFNLERRLDKVIEELVSTSNERLGDVIEFAQRLVVGIVGAFVGIILTLMVAAFISIDLPRVMAFLRSLVPRKARAGYDILLDQLDTGLAGVVRGQLLICVVNGILTYIGLWFLNVKFSVLLAVVAGILSLIPVFGTVLSTVPIVLIALTDGFGKGFAALLWILFIHGLEANVLNPKIIGTSAHIHPVIVIFALLAGESAYGLVGALLAVPTASILLTLFNFVRTRAWTQAESAEQST